MNHIHLSLLRGICQIPAYVAYEKGFFSEEGLDVELSIAPTAWIVPQQLAAGETQFAVIPWTRVAADEGQREGLRLVAGSGCEEAAVVVRHGLEPADVRNVAAPKEGGMKDLTAMALIESMGWTDVEVLRFPSGDGAIISFFGQGADAASMVEPYATMMEVLEVGKIVKRTGDIWPGAPGCSLTTTATMIQNEPDLVQRVVNAYVRAARYAEEEPDVAATCAAPFIGVADGIVRAALRANQPDVTAIQNTDTMEAILKFMKKLGYLKAIPENYAELRFLDHALAADAVPSEV